MKSSAIFLTLLLLFVCITLITSKSTNLKSRLQSENLSETKERVLSKGKSKMLLERCKRNTRGKLVCVYGN